VNRENESTAATELTPLSHDERRVLAVLVAVGGASLADEQIALFAEVDDVRPILAALERRGLVQKDERGRHAVPAGWLDRLRGALDVVDHADRVLRQLISIAEDGRLTLDDLDAVLGISHWAADAGRLTELLQLVKAVEQALSFMRRVEAWVELVGRARRAARELGDRETEAWADEQLQACETSLAGARRAGRGDSTAVRRLREDQPRRPSLARIGIAGAAITAAGVLGFAVALAMQEDEGQKTVTLSGQTITGPGETFTVPGPTVTVGGETVTLPGATVTQPGETVTLPNETVTLEGTTVTVTVTTGSGGVG
jgi:hypothetical protein